MNMEQSRAAKKKMTQTELAGMTGTEILELVNDHRALLRKQYKQICNLSGINTGLRYKVQELMADQS